MDTKRLTNMLLSLASRAAALSWGAAASFSFLVPGKLVFSEDGWCLSWRRAVGLTDKIVCFFGERQLAAYERAEFHLAAAKHGVSLNADEARWLGALSSAVFTEDTAVIVDIVSSRPGLVRLCDMLLGLRGGAARGNGIWRDRWMWVNDWSFSATVSARASGEEMRSGRRVADSAELPMECGWMRADGLTRLAGRMEEREDLAILCEAPKAADRGRRRV